MTPKPNTELPTRKRLGRDLPEVPPLAQQIDAGLRAEDQRGKGQGLKMCMSGTGAA